jgi:hypothetical protein
MCRINRISRKPWPVQIITNVKQLQDVEYLKCLGEPNNKRCKIYTRNQILD